MTLSTHGQGNIQVRWLIRRDMPDVLKIEQHSFGIPWTESDFLSCLRQRNCIGMVAEADHQILGFMIYELTKRQIWLRHFAVHPGSRRQKVGSRMIQRLVDKLSQQRRCDILIPVDEANLPAQLFLKAQGFRAIQILHRYEMDTSGQCADAYLMRFSLRRESLFADAFHPRNRFSHFLEELPE